MKTETTLFSLITFALLFASSMDGKSQIIHKSDPILLASYKEKLNDLVSKAIHKDAIVSDLGEWFAQHPHEAGTALAGVGMSGMTESNSAIRRVGVGIIISTWVKRNPEQVLAWLENAGMFDEEEELIAHASVRELLGRSPQHLINYLDKVPFPRTDSDPSAIAIKESVKQLFASHVHIAVEWISKTPEKMRLLSVADGEAMSAVALVAPEAVIGLAQRSEYIQEAGLVSAFGVLVRKAPHQAFKEFAENKWILNNRFLATQVADALIRNYSQTNLQEALKLSKDYGDLGLDTQCH